MDNSTRKSHSVRLHKDCGPICKVDRDTNLVEVFRCDNGSRHVARMKLSISNLRDGTVFCQIQDKACIENHWW